MTDFFILHCMLVVANIVAIILLDLRDKINKIKISELIIEDRNALTKYMNKQHWEYRKQWK